MGERVHSRLWSCLIDFVVPGGLPYTRRSSETFYLNAKSINFQDVSMNGLLDQSMYFEPAALKDPSAENDQQRTALLVKLKELIDLSLSEKQRDAMHSLLNGMPVEIFAEKTGSNRNAVYKLVHDARVKLRTGFEQAGYKAEDINSVFA